MGSDLYDVTVAGRKGKTVTLDVEIVHPDAGPALADPSFALMMIRDAADDDAAIAAEVSIDDVLDETWVKKYAKGFVTEVTGGTKGKAKRGELVVTVSHPAWIAHLPKGTSFESRAFRTGKRYDACKPIAPKRPEKAPATQEGGFIWVPRSVFASYVRDAPGCPELLELPAYGESAYVAVEKGGGDMETLRGWSGRAVQIGRDAGALVVTGPTSVVLLRYGDGYRGLRGTSPENVERIALKKNARLKEKLSYQGVLRLMTGAVTGAAVEGDRATLSLELGPASAGHIRSATDALWILARALPGYDLYRLEGDEPLARALLADAQRAGQPHWQETLPAIARKYVASFALEQVEAKPVPDLDKMSEADVRAFFLSHPFGRPKLEIRATDPAWLAHLGRTTYFPLPEWARPEPPASA